ncbi:hypothetical protein LMG19282_01043 [Cupriavidus campinensis]|uniref:Uncharacterized protein n=1 Tax=Cupriavidus campinensis TaxID=151783 RepID=A0AAE9I325_9BURK|nr:MULTISPECIES: hypothetical protein [Cupriavidus]URF06542.1 hypothetical protein M5D45_25955 [Cupriavidus campinensis]CAG2135192.1 hypothetical protein LMG19282_01043 [Cupriavidus campinensis]
MKIPPQLRPTDAAPLHQPRPLSPLTPLAVLYRMRGGILLLRVLALCAHTAVYAQPALAPAVTPEQKFSPGYLEAVSTGYENGQALGAVEGIAPVRPPRAERTDPAPAAPATPSAPRIPAAVLAHPPGSLRRVTAH